MNTEPSTDAKKRIIVCCDGTWQNSDNGAVKSAKKGPSLQIPSNVTRISRAFARTCGDGTFQVIYYQSGVGSRTGLIDRITGGAFGVGIAENIREAYAYICANYVDGDEIVLLGFSRGAFTARSIAGMIADLGLLTRDGMEFFYPVFKDMQHRDDYEYQDPFPDMPFSNKPKGPDADNIYRERLVEMKYSRVRQNGGAGELIRVKAVGVWDTVGSLGIPDVPLLSKLGVGRSTMEFKWYNTNLSHKIEHAFHALALDETRGPFQPALWERHAEHRDTTDLRQVWFPGSHANVGGGFQDQGVANTSLAWMMDQLSSVSVEFINTALEKLFERNVDYYKNLKPQEKGYSFTDKRPKYWALKEIEQPNSPIRPWALHQINSVENALYNLAGKVPRAPGLYKKINPNTGKHTHAFLEDTNERIHSSVRVRLACEGLSPNDKEVWRCPPLLRLWRPRRVQAHFYDPVSQNAAWGPLEANQSSVVAELGGLRWVWEYIGPEESAPTIRTMVEANMGPYEKHLLKLAAGAQPQSVFDMAEKEDFSRFKFPKFRDNISTKAVSRLQKEVYHT